MAKTRYVTITYSGGGRRIEMRLHKGWVFQVREIGEGGEPQKTGLVDAVTRTVKVAR
jgi:hypothetical protein